MLDATLNLIFLKHVQLLSDYLQFEIVILVVLKGLGRDWANVCLQKIFEIPIEFLQKVIQKCTNHFGKPYKVLQREECFVS